MRYFILFLFLFLQTVDTSAVSMNIHAFRFRTFVFYQILTQIQGVPNSEFSNVTVIRESSTECVFEYNGLQYRAVSLASGSILVYMPEGKKNRVIWTTPTSLVLTSYLPH